MLLGLLGIANWQCNVNARQRLTDTKSQHLDSIQNTLWFNFISVIFSNSRPTSKVYSALTPWLLHYFL